MSLLADQLSTVTVQAQSQDKTVRAELTYDHGLRVKLKPDCLAGHSTQSLARSIDSALYRVLNGFQNASDFKMNRLMAADERDALRESEVGRRMKPFIEAKDKVKAAATSPSQTIKIAWNGKVTATTVHMKALKTDETRVAEEIRAAFTAAMSTYADTISKLYTRLVDDEFRVNGARHGN
ncbi:MAG TPA: hypothetical protein H9902_08120 [Candidatus Stackebrandtia faecavium]|nr:hypothetical protein [Candidatus Stackebrandtia faecavium]